MVTETITDGEIVSSSASTTTIKGRLEPSEGITRAKHPDGQVTDVNGKFFTKSEVIAGAKKLTVNGVEYTILNWWPYQSYSEIWLD